MKFSEEGIRCETVIAVAKQMAVAARTAPKAKGVDNLEIRIIIGNDIELLATEMIQVGEAEHRRGLIRDAGNCTNSQAVLLIGSRLGSFGLNCKFCGFNTCSEKDEHPETPCFFNASDLGLAVGSAISIAADNRIDNRVMYSAGYVALKMGWLPQCTCALAIPLSVSGKSVFFDR